jgi:hypothetical protein
VFPILETSVITNARRPSEGTPSAAASSALEEATSSEQTSVTVDDHPSSPRMDLSCHVEQIPGLDSTLQDAIKEARAKRDSVSSTRQIDLEILETPARGSNRSLPFIDLNTFASPKPVAPQTLRRRASSMSLASVVHAEESCNTVSAADESAMVAGSSDESPDDGDGIEVETEGLVKISSRDPWAAARAAAILKQVSSACLWSRLPLTS